MANMGRQLSEETRRKRDKTLKKHRYEKAQKYIGEKYNHLIIDSINYERTEEEYAKGNAYGVFFNCHCDCGSDKNIITTLSRLKSGKQKSCGCLKKIPYNFEDLTGQTFGRLTVLGRDHSKKALHWLCECSCGGGKIPSVTSYQLRSGHTQSCGCYASEQIAKRNKKYSTKYNKVIFDAKYALIYDDNDNECVVDIEDYDVIKNWYWTLKEKRGDKNKGYWSTNSKIDDGYETSIIPLHQVIAEIKFGRYDHEKFMPDHLSRNPSDNRKCNIILKSNIENTHNRSLSKANTSGKTGVRWDDKKGKYQAYICVNYKQIHLGYFNTEEEAIEARLQAEEKYGFTCDNIYPDYDTESKEENMETD